jgi:predicted DNA binding CopG/RHH family protein
MNYDKFVKIRIELALLKRSKERCKANGISLSKHIRDLLWKDLLD